MKTSLTTLLILMTVMVFWSASQKDIVNMVISAVSMPVLILGYIYSTMLDNETKDPI